MEDYNKLIEVYNSLIQKEGKTHRVSNLFFIISELRSELWVKQEEEQEEKRKKVLESLPTLF